MQGPEALWALGRHKTTRKWRKRLADRGWTVETIDEAIRAPRETFDETNYIRPGNRAIRFAHPGTGNSVVLDVVTREVLHVGKTGFRYRADRLRRASR